MGLKVNFSSEEASSEARSIELLPRGEYHVKIFDVEERESQSEKNNGKPYWAIQFKVQDGKYADRSVWCNCMLFEGALYTFAQLMKALGYDTSEGEFEVPDEDTLVGRDVVVSVVVQGKRKGPDGNEYEARNDVRGIKAWVEGMDLASSAGTGGMVSKPKKNSLLP
jgi:hypothetical protein